MANKIIAFQYLCDPRRDPRRTLPGEIQFSTAFKALHIVLQDDALKAAIGDVEISRRKIQRRLGRLLREEWCGTCVDMRNARREARATKQKTRAVRA